MSIAGGWSAYRPLTKEDQLIFDEALKGLLGPVYKPTAVSTQVVAGTNYRFKCNTSVPPSEVVYESIVEIFAPLPGEGKPHVTQIVRV